MNRVKFSYDKAKDFINDKEIEIMVDTAKAAKKALLNRTGTGSEMLGWVDLPVSYDHKEFERIKTAAQKIRSDSKVFVVIGIGGSYLGSKAAISFLNDNFSNQTRDDIEIYFAGHNISGSYLFDLIKVIGDRDFSINVISKSGTTTEPALAFRVLKKLLVEKYGEDNARSRIYATTDKARGALYQLATSEGYQKFVIPDDVGGRFTVLSAVGLLPIAVNGSDIDELMRGAFDYRNHIIENDVDDALLYASLRNILNRKGKMIEILANYEPNLHYLSEWWKQLMGESEGKDGKGIYPASVDYSTDLHSLGQFVQDGSRTMFETVINVQNVDKDITIDLETNDLDGLNYLVEKPLDFVNKCAQNGTIIAHVEGGVPNLLVSIPQMDEYVLGQLFYFFEFACGVSGYILGVNPFDQPGVEAYKKNMFALLNKPGFEKEHEELIKKL
ncbi:MAG: glucose-6-phosphate isomerase [Erysipelotrichaceae bacterium]|nr:glucose-6-phosphate isomerase [Erysipelotrichaceae bacterium]